MATETDNNGDDTTEVHVTVPKDDTPEPVVEAGDTTVVVTNPPDDSAETDRAVDTAVELNELRHQLEMVNGELAASRRESEAAAALALAAAEEIVTEPEPEPEPMPEDVPPGRTGHWLTRTFADWRN